MTKRYLHVSLMVLMVLMQASCMLQAFTKEDPEQAVPTEGCGTLGKLPFREAWYGMYFKEDKIGYSHFRVESSGSDFIIHTDSLLRLTAMKKTSEIDMKESVTVHPDLTLVSFESKVTMNGKPMTMMGKVDGDRLSVDIAVDGEKLHRDYPVSGKCYHSSAVSFMPALKGLKEGQRSAFSIFNAERQAFDKVEQELASVKGSPGPSGAVWKLRNQYARSHVLAWLDKKGLTVLEKGMDGSLLTVLEDESTAKKFLEKKVSSKDLVLDVSLIRVSRKIPAPEKVRYLKVRVQGIEPSLIATDHRQRVGAGADTDPSQGFELTVQKEDPSRVAAGVGTDASQDPTEEFLGATLTIQANHKEIADQAAQIVAAGDTVLQKVTKLAQWTADNVRNEVKQSFTALAVLRSREGECKAHANLYAALARSQGIPTRVVAGLVYTKNLGFLYHAWAESFVGGWLSVDPTSKQIPVDATHIKVAPGDAGDETAAISEMLGRVNMEILDVQ
jgi:hypothetical protein